MINRVDSPQFDAWIERLRLVSGQPASTDRPRDLQQSIQWAEQTGVSTDRLLKEFAAALNID
jgi:hypothetical protein